MTWIDLPAILSFFLAKRSGSYSKELGSEIERSAPTLVTGKAGMSINVIHRFRLRPLQRTLMSLFLQRHWQAVSRLGSPRPKLACGLAWQ